MESEKIVVLFENAIMTRSSDEVDRAVTATFSVDDPGDFVSYLCQLLECDWHHDHEDIGRLLQQIANPKSIKVLFKTATRKFKYLDYDDSKPLSRKCTWASADIGNGDSKEALLELAKNPDREAASIKSDCILYTVNMLVSP